MQSLSELSAKAVADNTQDYAILDNPFPPTAYNALVYAWSWQWMLKNDAFITKFKLFPTFPRKRGNMRIQRGRSLPTLWIVPNTILSFGIDHVTRKKMTVLRYPSAFYAKLNI